MNTTDRHPADTRTEINVTLTDAEIAALDAWRRKQPDAVERPEALRRLAALALDGDARQGGRETIPLEDLNSSNDK